MMEWIPIETFSGGSDAPWNGEVVWLWAAGEKWLGCWKQNIWHASEDGYWRLDAHISDLGGRPSIALVSYRKEDANPTRWMPLPAPPKEGE